MLTMEIRIVLLLLWLGLPIFGWAQEQKAVSYQLKFSPLALLDPNTPVLQLGPQVNFKRYGLSAEFGLAFDGLAGLGRTREDSLFVDPAYYKVRTEAKYFLGRGKNNYAAVNPYLSVEGFWVPRRFGRYNDVIFRAGGTYRYAYSDISRNVLGGCFKFGLEPVLYKRWILDAFFGLGVRRLMISHKPVGQVREIPSAIMPMLWWAGFRRIDQREGSFYRPHLAMGFKIGYVLN
jgi:hypothetical protein